MRSHGYMAGYIGFAKKKFGIWRRRQRGPRSKFFKMKPLRVLKVSLSDDSVMSEKSCCSSTASTFIPASPKSLHMALNSSDFWWPRAKPLAAGLPFLEQSMQLLIDVSSDEENSSFQMSTRW